MKLVIGIIIGALLLVIVGVLFFGNKETFVQKDFVPDLTLIDQDTGSPIELSSFKGAPAVINSWATWCPFCVQEIPDFEETQEKFGDQVAIVLINRKEEKESILSFLKERGVLEDSPIAFILDEKDSYYKLTGGFSMPETLFVNADGSIAFHKRGVMDLAEMQELTQKLIDGAL